MKPKRVFLSLRIYRALARAFPHEFRNRYGVELLQATEDAIDEIWRSQGVWGLARVLADVAIRVPIEHLSEFSRDVRYGLRMLAGAPGFTLVALLSLGLGMAIATCAFSEMNGTVLRSIPGVERPGDLMGFQAPVSYPSYKRYREQKDLFSSTLAYVAPVPFEVSLGSGIERTWGHLVTPSYFATLGVHAALGRFFDSAYEQPGRPPAIVISDRFWRDHFSSDPSIIGRSLRVNGQPCTIIGVGPQDFLGASPYLFSADVWMPLSVGEHFTPELANHVLERPDVAMFRIAGRLQPGVSPFNAEAELDTIAQQMERENGALQRDRKGRRVLLVEGGKLFPLRKQDQPFFSSFLLIVAGLVMLIACANVANMMLARAAGRRREMAVRLSLGASRARIIRQLLTESMLVAVGAGVLGFVLSTWLMHLSSQVRLPFPMPVTFDFRPDVRVFWFTLGLSGITGLFFGLAPALQATRTDLTPALKEGGQMRYSRFRRLSLRNMLMISQMGGSVTLLVILGLVSLGIQTTLGIQSGFNPAHMFLISLDPIRDGYSGAQAAAFFDKLLDRIKKLPSITTACLTESVPVSMPGDGVTFSTPGSTGRLTDHALKHVVGKDYFDVTGIPILTGRAFRKEDESNQANTVIVSEALVRELWRGEDVIGRSIEIGGDDPKPAKILPGSYDYRAAAARNIQRVFVVAGVARDVAEGLVVQKPKPTIYFPMHAADYAQPGLQGVTLMVRAMPGVDALGALRREISAMDANLTPFNARSMVEQIDQFMAMLRVASWTYAVIGIFGLVLAAVGLAGMTAYSVARRGREIGIRMALGARSSNVLGLVLKEGAGLVTAGTLIGMAGGLAGARLLAAMSSAVGTVTSTSTSDPVVLLGAPLLLAGLAMLACYLPARKATGIDPAVALRQE